MTVTPETAKRTVGLIDFAGSIERAIRECAITLTAIAPYTDKATSRVQGVLIHLDRATPERRAVLLSQLNAIASK